MDDVTIQRESDDRLQRQMWTFWFDDRTHCLVLNTYLFQTRITRRHAWTTMDKYMRLYQRQSMPIVDVPLPDDVASEAHTQYTQKIRVVRQ